LNVTYSGLVTLVRYDNGSYCRVQNTHNDATNIHVIALVLKVQRTLAKILCHSLQEVTLNSSSWKFM